MTVGFKKTWLSVSLLAISLTGCDKLNTHKTDNQSNKVASAPSVISTTIDTPSKHVVLGTGKGTFAGTNSPLELYVLDNLNKLRNQCGFGQLTSNTELNKAAYNHANYLAYVSTYNQDPFTTHREQDEFFENKAYVSYTGKSNPYYSGEKSVDRLNTDNIADKATPVKYNVAYSTESLGLSRFVTRQPIVSIDNKADAKEMLFNLLASPYQMQGLLFPEYKDIGVSYVASNWKNGDVNTMGGFLVMLSAFTKNTPRMPNTKLITYPCEGATVAYKGDSDSLNPFEIDRDLQQDPIGQPIYLLSPVYKNIDDVSASLTSKGREFGLLGLVTRKNDPNQRLHPYEALVIPDTPLTPNETYHVDLLITYEDSSQEKRSFSFKTQPAFNKEKLITIQKGSDPMSIASTTAVIPNTSPAIVPDIAK